MKAPIDLGGGFSRVVSPNNSKTQESFNMMSIDEYTKSDQFLPNQTTRIDQMNKHVTIGRSSHELMLKHRLKKKLSIGNPQNDNRSRIIPNRLFRNPK